MRVRVANSWQSEQHEGTRASALPALQGCPPPDLSPAPQNLSNPPPKPAGRTRSESMRGREYVSVVGRITLWQREEAGALRQGGGGGEGRGQGAWREGVPISGFIICSIPAVFRRCSKHRSQLRAAGMCRLERREVACARPGARQEVRDGWGSRPLTPHPVFPLPA